MKKIEISEKALFKLKLFANAILSLVLPFLWYWTIFKASDKYLFICLVTIFVTQLVSVFVGYKKETRFITIFGVVSSILIFLSFFPVISELQDSQSLNSACLGFTILYYFLYLTESFGTLGDVLLKKKPWYSKTSKNRFGK